MTVTDTRRRPSPRPRPHAETVTDSKAPASSGVPADPTPERETAAEGSSLQSRSDALRNRIRDALGRTRGYWVPPQFLTNAPPTVAELSAYARHGAWTARHDGPVRAYGVAWYGGVALAVTAGCRWFEWTCQRPLRALAAYVLWRLLITTAPGQWVADYIIRPICAAAAWVLL